MERILRLVQLVTSAGLPAYDALKLVGCLVPHYLSLAVPAGFFIGTMIRIRSLHERSELVVMRTFGMTMKRMQRPILLIAISLCVLLFVLSGFVQPHFRYIYRASINALNAQSNIAGLREGVFYEIGDNVIRADRILPDGTFEGFFVTKKTAPDSRVYLTAKTAKKIEQEDDNSGDINFLLTDGVLIDERVGEDNKKINFQLAFEKIPTSITTEKVLKKFRKRGNDERELTTPELLAGGITGRIVEASSKELNTEWHSRILNILSVPVLGILAIPLALIGQGRGAQARGGIIGLILFVAYEKSLGVGEAMAASGKISPWVGLWGPWLLLILLTIILFSCYSGDSTRRGIIDSVQSIFKNPTQKEAR